MEIKESIDRLAEKIMRNSKMSGIDKAEAMYQLANSRTLLAASGADTEEIEKRKSNKRFVEFRLPQNENVFIDVDRIETIKMSGYYEVENEFIECIQVSVNGFYYDLIDYKTVDSFIKEFYENK